MKAAICTQYGGPEVLQLGEVAQPKAGESEILVRIVATAVNSGDVRVRRLQVKGVLKLVMRLVLGISKPRKPILGVVFSGVVDNCGSKVNRFKVGDRVFGMTGFSFGTYAEYVAVDQKSNVLTMPHNATFEEAAAIVFGGLTAMHYLDKAKIADRRQPAVLILGASGSVGVAAVQIARHYQAKVTGVCSSAGEKCLAGLGVEELVFYDREDFTQSPKRYDIIFDAVGKYHKKQCSGLLAQGGVYVSVNRGYAAEKITQLAFLKELFEQGVFAATIDRVFTLDEVVAAHSYVETGRKKGNVVLRISEA